LAYFENALNAYGATIVVDERHRLPIGDRSPIAHGERRQLDEALDEPMGNHNGMTRRAARLGRSCGLSARSGSGIGLPYRPVGWTIRR
jgi:hypothetical protein